MRYKSRTFLGFLREVTLKEKQHKANKLIKKKSVHLKKVKTKSYLI